MELILPFILVLFASFFQGTFGLGMKFIPLGSCNMSNARTYLESPLITAIGGSWVAKRPLIQNENWDEITANAKEIRDLICDIRETK